MLKKYFSLKCRVKFVVFSIVKKDLGPGEPRQLRFIRRMSKYTTIRKKVSEMPVIKFDKNVRSVNPERYGLQ